MPDAAHPNGPADLTGAVPAASAILLRDGAAGLEVLLLQRTSKASFAPDAWVFPGGRVDPEDGPDPYSVSSARTAAARETLEEAGIAIAAADLVPYAQWCPPPQSPKRFLTWLFVVEAPAAGVVVVDGSEIMDSVWVRPADALAARDEGRVDLLPPTWITLWNLSHAESAAAVVRAAREGSPAFFETHIAFLPRPDDPEQSDVVALWEGDAGYEAHDATLPGPRHRLRMGAAPWTYERTP